MYGPFYGCIRRTEAAPKNEPCLATQVQSQWMVVPVFILALRITTVPLRVCRRPPEART